MSKSPAFQLYVQDFLLGTLHFTAEEVGGYIRLLLHQWDRGSLPDNDTELKKLSGLRPKSLATVKQKFVLTPNGTLQNRRLEQTRQMQHEYREKQRLNIQKRWSKERENNIPPNTDGIYQTHTLQSTSSTSPSNLNTEIQNTGTAGAGGKKNEPVETENTTGKNTLTTKPCVEPVPLPWPGHNFAQAWQHWKTYRQTEHRKRFKTTVAELAQLKKLYELARGNPTTAIAIMHQSIGNHWQGLFELRNQNTNHATTKQPPAKVPCWRLPVENNR